MENQGKSLYAQYKTNKNLETEGVVLDFGGPKFKVRRAGGSNRKYAAVFNAKMRPHAQALARGALGEEKGRDLLIDIFFDAVMLDWQNVTDENGEPMEYNRANFTKLMKDLPDFWATLREETQEIKNFQDEQDDEDAAALGN